MNRLYHSLCIVCLTLCLQGCGVKGLPQPPLVPAQIGRGEPTFSRATQEVEIKKTKPKIEGDFEDEDEFIEGEDSK